MDSSLIIARILYIVMWIVLFFLIASLVSTILSYFVIDVSKYTINSEKIPSIFNGYKILQISDLHDTSFGKDNEKLFKKIEEIKPDIIVMTGDMANTKTKNFNKFYTFAKKMAEIYPTYYIMGNHEMRMSGPNQLDIIRKLNGFGVKVLNNTETTILKDDESIQLYGLHQPLAAYKNILKNNEEIDFTLDHMNKIFSAVDKDKFNILLSHSPFDFEVFSDWGADLVLSGHVHGGLIRLPFIGGILSPERTLFPKYDAGEYLDGTSTMIVSRGLGNGTINLRLFNNPEICVITLENKD